MEKEVQQRLIKIIEKLSKKVKGVSVAITNQNETIFEYYHGIIDEKMTPNDNTKMMMIASNTKIITAIAIMQLVEKEKIQLDDDIHLYLKELKIPSRFEYDKITIRQLLMHRSGIAGDDYSLFFDESKFMEDIIPVLNKTYMITKPGTMYSYCNLGYGLLGLLIERVTNQSYTNYIEEKILKPLGLSVKILSLKSERDKYKGIISESFDKKGKVTEDLLAVILSAGSNTYATAEDLMKLMRVFLNPKEQSILSEESINKMLKKPEGSMFKDDEIRHGLGLMFNRVNYTKVKTGDIICHGGNTINHHSKFQFDPELSLGIAVMTNSKRGLLISNAIVNKVFLEYLKIVKVPKSETLETSKEIETDLSQYEGEYVGSNMYFNIRYAKHKRLESKLSFMRFHLVLREDGYFNTHPLGIARLPIFAKRLKVMSLKFNNINGGTVVYLKQYQASIFVIFPLLVPYKKQGDLSIYDDLIGKYEVYGPTDECRKNFDKASISIKDGRPIVKITMVSSKAKFYLHAIDENTFITQGIGRNSRDTIKITKTDNEIKGVFYGVQFKKNINKI